MANRWVSHAKRVVVVVRLRVEFGSSIAGPGHNGAEGKRRRRENANDPRSDRYHWYRLPLPRGHRAGSVLGSADEGGDAIKEIPANRFDIDAFYDARPGIPASSTADGADSSIRSISSIRTSSAFPRARRRAWIRSIACCSRSRGKRSRTPDRCRSSCSASRWACSLACAPTIT